MKILNIAHLLHNGDGGDAAAIRINFIMKGLQEKGAIIQTISYAHDKKALKNYKCEDANFKYLSTTYIDQVFLRNFFKLLIQPLLLFFYINKYRNNTDVIFFDRIPPYLALPLLLAKIFFRMKIIWGVNEFPAEFISGNMNSIKKLVEKVCFTIFGRISSLIIVISSEHQSCYRQYASKKTKLLVIPILMDITDIHQVEENITDERVIAYGGALSSSNGIDYLLKVAKELLLATDKFKLSLFGPSISPEYLNSLRSKIELFKLEKNVLLIEPMPNEEAIKYMRVCDILVIPKIKDQRSIGYIPSKLGDFLFSGKPVVATNVGDVPKYISDGINGYLVKPDDVKGFSECLYKLIVNYDEAFLVGKEGQRTALLFDYKIQSQTLHHLLSEM